MTRYSRPIVPLVLSPAQPSGEEKKITIGSVAALKAEEAREEGYITLVSGLHCLTNWAARAGPEPSFQGECDAFAVCYVYFRKGECALMWDPRSTANLCNPRSR